MGSIESQGNLAKAGGPSASRACGRSPAKRETPRAQQRPPRPFPPRPARRGFINAGCPLAFAQFVHLPFEGCRVPRKATPLPDYCRIGRLRGRLASAPCCCFSDLHCGGPCSLQGRALALSREQIRRPPPPALPLKDDLGLGSMSGAQAEGKAGALPPSLVSIPGPPPPQCLRQVPSRPWAILLHPGRRGTHHPCPVVVRTRDPLDRSVPAEDGREVNVT